MKDENYNDNMRGVTIYFKKTFDLLRYSCKIHICRDFIKYRVFKEGYVIKFTQQILNKTNINVQVDSHRSKAPWQS